jgi:uncharacterized protein YsxB (DUF464 family)
MKTIHSISICLFIVVVIFFIINGIIKNKKIRNNFYEKEYYGRILEINHISNQRGLAIIKLNDTLYQLGELERKIQEFIIVGDSIVKRPNTFSIEIYRKNYQNDWEKKIFE